MSNDALLGFVGGLVAALLGFWFTRRAKADDDRQQAFGVLIVLQRDVQRGVERFREYLQDNVAAPAYRLPTSTWAASFASLAGNGAINAAEIVPLAQFFELVGEMNYCLDEIARTDLTSSRGAAEVSRARIKSDRATNPHDGESQSIAQLAQSAADQAVARARIRLPFWRPY